MLGRKRNRWPPASLTSITTRARSTSALRRAGTSSAATGSPPATARAAASVNQSGIAESKAGHLKGARENFDLVYEKAVEKKPVPAQPKRS